MYSHAFHRLDQTLTITRSLWGHRPFYNANTPWADDHPALYAALTHLDSAVAEELATDNEKLNQWFNEHIPETCQALNTFKPSCLSTLSPHSDHKAAIGIPGRKWAQIQCFNASLPPLAHPVVEWCAGKAHLGRVLHRHHKQPVLSLEYDQQLCMAGSRLAEQQEVDVEILHHDVMTTLPLKAKGQHIAHVGLHACGQLHMQLLQFATQQQAAQIAISPCCYHKILDDHYHPLSTIAKQATLTLSKNELHLAQEETVTAGQRVKNLRRMEQQWRLGFDALERQLTGHDSYRPLPSTPKAIFATTFKEFCAWAAHKHHLAIPKNIDYADFLSQGEKRRQQVVKLELVRQLFRRPLELWLALDRVLYLEEAGYRVELGEFCHRKTTPRNLLIYAER